MNLFDRLVYRFLWMAGRGDAAERFAISVRIDDKNSHKGWAGITDRRSLDRARWEMGEQYSDAVEAWRKNPLATRTAAIVANFVLGDGLLISSPVESLQRFIESFWSHWMNNCENQLEPLSHEFVIAGDVFVLLLRNPVDGMSYWRFLLKDEIDHIEFARNDRQTELIYWQKNGLDALIPWYGPLHPDAPAQNAICLHYSVNRLLGTAFGEGDLSSVIPWLLRYSRMLEARVRLHWAVRVFLWFLKTSGKLVAVKQEQYREAPESGTVIVHDESEEWSVQSPSLRAADARYDLRAVRQMIDAGTGIPPHWRGEADSLNQATARMMESPTERQLKRRQGYFVWMLCDVLYHAYTRAAQIGKVEPLRERNYTRLFVTTRPDVSREDNQQLANAAREITQALTGLGKQMPNAGHGRKYIKLALRYMTRFSGDSLTDEQLDELVDEAFTDDQT